MGDNRIKPLKKFSRHQDLAGGQMLRMATIRYLYMMAGCRLEAPYGQQVQLPGSGGAEGVGSRQRRPAPDTPDHIPRTQLVQGGRKTYNLQLFIRLFILYQETWSFHLGS